MISRSKFSSGATLKNCAATCATCGIELDRGEMEAGDALVVIPGGAAAAEADDRGVLQGRRVGEADGHRLGVVDRQVEFVVGIDHRFGVAEALGAEGQDVLAVGALVDVDVVVEGLDPRDQARVRIPVSATSSVFGCGHSRKRQHRRDDDHAGDADQDGGARAGCRLRVSGLAADRPADFALPLFAMMLLGTPRVGGGV